MLKRKIYAEDLNNAESEFAVVLSQGLLRIDTD